MAAHANIATTVTMKPSGYIAASIRPEVRTNLVQKTSRVTQLAKQYAPVDTGRLRASIRYVARDDLGRFATQSPQNESICAYQVLVPVPYAGFVTYGTRPHIIRSKGPWSLHNAKTGQYFGRVVRHPGTKPNDYLQRALEGGMTSG